MRHSVNVDFGEVYGFGDKSLEPIGLNNINKGKVVAKTFLDLKTKSYSPYILILLYTIQPHYASL